VIAATALEHNLVLVTGNTTHFAWVTGLRVEDWRIL
jgi:predicted nucleic acid-binding protein